MELQALLHAKPMIGLAFLAFILSVVGTVFYNLFLHPLRRFPGPLLMRASRLPYCYKLMTGMLPYDTLDLHKQYGDVVRVAPNELVFADSSAWRSILGHRSQGGFDLDKNLAFYQPMADLLPIETDIVNAGREEHAQLRRALAHGFSEKSLREQQPILRKYIDLLIVRLKEKSEGGEKVLDLARWYNYTTFDIIGELAFGESFGCLSSSDYHPWIAFIFKMARFGTVLQSLVHYPLVKRLCVFLGKKQMIRTMRTHADLTSEMLQRRMDVKVERPDLIEGLLKKKDEWKLSFAKIQENSSILIIGGSETTATLLSGVTYFLMRNPECLKRLTDEVRSTFKSEDEIDFTAVSNLPYLLACLEEALRRYPPVPTGLPRLTGPGGATIAGHFVPQNTIVSVVHWAMYHNEKNFAKPFEYHPERWLGTDPEFANDDREAFQPFHMGSRNCIGRNLAYIEMRLILARIVWNFDLKLADDSIGFVENQKIYLLWEKGTLNTYLTPVAR